MSVQHFLWASFCCCCCCCYFSNLNMFPKSVSAIYLVQNNFRISVKILIPTYFLLPLSIDYFYLVQIHFSVPGKILIPTYLLSLLSINYFKMSSSILLTCGCWFLDFFLFYLTTSLSFWPPIVSVAFSKQTLDFIFLSTHATFKSFVFYPFKWSFTYEPWCFLAIQSLHAFT